MISPQQIYMCTCTYYFFESAIATAIPCCLNLHSQPIHLRSVPSGTRLALSPIVSEFETEEQAASYDRWFRAQVQASLDDPRPSIPHDQVMAEMDANHIINRQQSLSEVQFLCRSSACNKPQLQHKIQYFRFSAPAPAQKVVT